MKKKAASKEEVPAKGHFCDGGFSMGGVSTSFWTNTPIKECYCKKKPFQELPGDHH